MTLRKLWLVFLASLLSTTVCAGVMGLDSGFQTGNFVATLNIGPAWARPGEVQTLTLQPEVIKTYHPATISRQLRFIDTAKGTDSLVSGELFLGFRGLINSVVEGQLGLLLSASSQAKLKGTIWEDADPFFSNYNYAYSVISNRIAVGTKLLYDPGYFDLFPYLSGSIGASYNRSTSWSIEPKIFEEVPHPLFSNNGDTALSYSVGVGLETSLDTNWRLGLGYEFVDWGRSSLGKALFQTVGQKGPRLSSLRAHELMINLSFIS